MSGAVHVIGITPGPTTGIAACSWMDGHLAYAWAAQVTPTLVLPLVAMVAADMPGPTTLAVQRINLPAYSADGDTASTSPARSRSCTGPASSPCTCKPCPKPAGPPSNASKPQASSTGSAACADPSCAQPGTPCTAPTTAGRCLTRLARSEQHEHVLG